MAAGIFTVMTTWNTGRRLLGEALEGAFLPLDLFLEDVKNTNPTRVRGSAVFMSSNPSGVPPILLHHFKHNQVLHDQVVLLTVLGLHVPEVPARSTGRGGDAAPRLLPREGELRLHAAPQHPARPHRLRPLRADALARAGPSYYLGRETLLPTGRSRMARWRKQLFAFISRNARPATAYFGLPPNRVVELGMQVDL